jgi:hypothetical protein
MASFAAARPRAIVAFAATVALGAALVACSATTAASPTACVVRNVETGVAKDSLQAAANAASSGDHLRVRGTCPGTTTIRKSLTIAGIQTATSGTPTLGGYVGGDAAPHWVVKVPSGISVTMRDLTIRGGSNASGIRNQGSLALRDVIVRDNGFMAGGGVWNWNGTLVLWGSSSIRFNEGGWGGGVMNEGGRLVLNDASSIVGNTAIGQGGGVFNGDGGTLVMRDASVIRGNTAGQGGGIISEGTLVGVVCAPAAGANVRGNTPDDCWSLIDPES